jgi:very-short-patch-repair endonuclease
MSILRFPNQKALEDALGKHIKIKDTFPNSQHAGSHTSSQNKARAGRRKALGPTPHDILWVAVSQALGGVEREFMNAVPGRRFRIDIALPALRLAIEVDGWEWHGKHKGDFTRDRERQNLLTLHGWRILRFTAGQIRKDVAGCVEMIRKASMVAMSAP